jgi:hypothetical protein
MKCAGTIGADGTTALAVGPSALTREVNAEDRSYAGRGLTLIYDPDCSSCEAEALCPFFPVSARKIGFPCPSGIPHGERSHKLTPSVVVFEDLPGVHGDGWPSGGRDAASGLDGHSARYGSSVYRATCTLPASERWICTVSLNDVRSRYG